MPTSGRSWTPWSISIRSNGAGSRDTAGIRKTTWPMRWPTGVWIRYWAEGQCRMREIVLDTETTGIEVREGHRIIEIGCVELLDRRLTGRHFHVYINPQREVEEGAFAVHGISDAFLADKPLFADVVDDFMAVVKGARLRIRNGAFDVGFSDAELQLLRGGHGQVADHCSVVDTLRIARDKHRGQRNSLDALCKRYGVDNSQRELHRALLDAEI